MMTITPLNIEHYNIINMKTVNISRAAYAIMLTLMLINFRDLN